MKLKTVLMALTLYILQVGALWGLIEGYTYFKGDNLKTILGSYWIIIYIIPILSTIYVLYNKTSDKTSTNEAVVTQRNYSPGYVGGDYKVTVRGYRKPRTDPPFILPQLC